MHDEPGVRVEIGELPGLEALQAAWLELEARSEPSFFRSWAWVGTWLQSLPAAMRPLLVRATTDARTAALGILFARRVRRGGVIRSRGLWLNSTGDPYFDELTVEYNGLLCESGAEHAVAGAFARALLERPDWDEVFIDGLDRIDLVQALSPAPLAVSSRVRSDYYVDLAALRESRAGYVESLKPHVRRNLRRTMKDAQEHGAIAFDVATTVAQAGEYLDGLERLHTRSWNARGAPGAFANRYFREFHAALVRAHFAAGLIQMCRLRVGERTAGYLYNFSHRGRVYVYQTGFDLEFDPRHSWRPGMLCHIHAIELNRERGCASYNFMAGEHEYKRHMSTARAQMAWLVIQRPRLRFRAESWLRRARDTGRAWMARREAPRPDADPPGDAASAG